MEGMCLRTFLSQTYAVEGGETRQKASLPAVRRELNTKKIFCLPVLV